MEERYFVTKENPLKKNIFTSPENVDKVWKTNGFEIWFIDDEDELYSHIIFVPGITHRNAKIKEIYFNSKFLLHRNNDQPAVVWIDDTKMWFQNGQLHREGDLPALIEPNGDRGWYKNGKIHREGDFPAFIYADGAKYWYKDGNRHRDNDKPAVIEENGHTLEWFFEGEHHRYGDNPTVIDSDGTLLWHKNGNLHRDNGFPAVIKPNGEEKWYENGKEIEKNENCLSEMNFKPAKQNK